MDGDLHERGNVEHSSFATRTTNSDVKSILSGEPAGDTSLRFTTLVTVGAGQTQAQKTACKCDNYTVTDGVGTVVPIENSIRSLDGPIETGSSPEMR